MDPQPVSKTVTQVKTKSDPEALLNSLSSSLKSFQTTVRTWTANSPQKHSQTNGQAMEMRPSRLGLGAKQERKVAAGDSVAGNLALKKQLTGVNASATKKNGFQHITKQQNKKTTHKRKEFDDDDCGRASMISNKCRNKK